MQNLKEKILASASEFTKLRRDLHQHPETGFAEKYTSELVAQKLSEWGYQVERGLAQTGVVGTLQVGNGSKRLGIRADMDALPMEENTGLAWSSQNQGCFHGCGHDGHTAILLCAAKYLAETKNFTGTLHLIFQPGEELLYGGRVMLADGLWEKFPCDAVFALHNMPGFKEGVFYFRPGALMASADTVELEIKGIGGHGAIPQKTVDATLVACYIVVALQSIVSRNISPFRQAVVTVGSIETGEAANIISDRALLKLSVRSLNPEVRTLLLKRIEEIAVWQAQSFGASAEFKHLNGCPVLVNDQEMTDFALTVARETFGDTKASTKIAPFMGSEDFAFMLEERRGCYVILGAGDEKERAGVHNPHYDFNDELIVAGATYWCALAEKYLK